MEKIDKIIYWKLIEISLLISVVIISFPLWKKLEWNDFFTTAAFYSEAQYSYLEVSNYPKGPMFPISNEIALKNINQTTLSVINDTLTEEEYTLLLKITKDSTLDYHCLNVALNNKISALENKYIMENEEYWYFKLSSDTILGETKTLNFIMWMDEKTGNEMQGKTLNYAFEIQKGMMI